MGQQHGKEQDSREGNSQLRRNLDASVTNTAAMKSVTREEEGWGSRPGTPGVGQLSAGRGLRIRVLHPQALLAEAQRLPAHAARTRRHPRSSGLASGERTAQHTEAGPLCVRRYSRHPPPSLPRSTPSSPALLLCSSQAPRRPSTPTALAGLLWGWRCRGAGGYFVRLPLRGRGSDEQRVRLFVL